MNSKKYSILMNNKISFKNYSIRPLRKCDIQKIRIWRNDQINILRQTTRLTPQNQLNYYNKFIKKSFQDNKPNIILFSFLLDKICIGYGGLVHIDWNSKSTEISFLNITSRSKSKIIYQKDFSIFLKLIFNVVFNDLKFNKITTETYDIRPWTITTLEKLGFKRDKILKKHVIIDDKPYDSILHSKLINT
jgi:RimJ/RimL family protein N-acetyltransferase